MIYICNNLALKKQDISGIPRVVQNLIKFLPCIPIVISETNLYDFNKTKIKLVKGDTIFFPDADWGWQITIKDLLISKKSEGIKLIHLIHDVIPLSHPETSQFTTIRIFKDWFSLVSEISDGIVCVSKTTANEVKKYIKNMAIPITWFHLATTTITTTNVMRKPKSILMVSTIEPRKKYLNTIMAIERLIDEDPEVTLTIVGKMGWNVQDTIDYISNSNHLRKNIFCRADLTDEQLNNLYQTSSLFIQASDQEGFGLPIIEAASFNTPLLVRDIPVFREIAGEHAEYFSDFYDLPQKIKTILSNPTTKHSRDINVKTWEQSSADCLNCINQLVTKCESSTSQHTTQEIIFASQ